MAYIKKFNMVRELRKLEAGKRSRVDLSVLAGIVANLLVALTAK
jgi:hypothetical protein